MKFKHPDHTSQFEKQIFSYIDRIPLDHNFYDLGACMGTFSLYAAIRGIQNVVAFEIDPDNYKGLTENIEVNGLSSKILTINEGISDGTSTYGVLTIAPWSFGKIGTHNKNLAVPRSTSVAADRSHYKRISVMIDSLDNFVKKRNLPEPLHVKVDIDGAELAFLEGASNALKSSQSIMIEVFEGNAYHKEIYTTLHQCGFTLTAKHPITQPGCINYFNCEFWKK